METHCYRYILSDILTSGNSTIDWLNFQKRSFSATCFFKAKEEEYQVFTFDFPSFNNEGRDILIDMLLNIRAIAGCSSLKYPKVNVCPRKFKYPLAHSTRSWINRQIFYLFCPVKTMQRFQKRGDHLDKLLLTVSSLVHSKLDMFSSQSQF